MIQTSTTCLPLIQNPFFFLMSSPSCESTHTKMLLPQNRFHSLPFPISPYLRFDLGEGQWVRCNEQIQKSCHYPVFGLTEGHMYQFRVRAVNQAGAGRPSKATDPILTADPLEHTRSMGNTAHTLTETKPWQNLEIKFLHKRLCGLFFTSQINRKRNIKGFFHDCLVHLLVFCPPFEDAQEEL